MLDWALDELTTDPVLLREQEAGWSGSRTRSNGTLDPADVAEAMPVSNPAPRQDAQPESAEPTSSLVAVSCWQSVSPVSARVLWPRRTGGPGIDADRPNEQSMH